MAYYDIPTHQWVYSRHSDAAVAGVIRLKNDLESVLTQRGYGSLYPAKRCIVTESNISRMSFNEQMGSALGQLNFAMKAIIAAHRYDIDQFHFFLLADKKTTTQATNPWDLMGMYYAINTVQPYQQGIVPAGIACKTTMDMLKGYRYDAAHTTLLQLPDAVQGAAFADSTGAHIYALWAKTSTDQSEAAAYTYAFPPEMDLSVLEMREWDYSSTDAAELVNASKISLNSTPVFLIPSSVTDVTTMAIPPFQVHFFPNPYLGGDGKLIVKTTQTVSLHIVLLDAQGRKVATLASGSSLAAGNHEFDISRLSLASGIYHCQLSSGDFSVSQRIICL
ncbi:MAG: T9SS type A sorting domain-containing protein [Saprospiraceae bacterium]